MKCSTILCLFLGCIAAGHSNSEPINYNYKTGYENAMGVPSGPMDMGSPTFDEMKTFGTGKSRDAMENIFSQNKNLSSDGMRCFIQGDIPIPCDQMNSTRVRRNALRNRGRQWANGVVPYVIDNRFSTDARARIQRGFDRYHGATCIRFVQRTTQRDYIYIFPGSGCYSLVGRVGGMQQVSLGSGCTNVLGTIVHEFMHAIGFHHEQTRADRDSFVQILFQNIQSGLENNFEGYDLSYIDHLGTQYDYFSVMHYHMTAFTRNGQPTIVARDQSIRLDYRTDFSANDIRKINAYYNCDGTQPQPTEAPPQEVCIDMNQYCPYWARVGYCSDSRFSQWLSVNCAASCLVCRANAAGSPSCMDMNDKCAEWAEAGECDANPAYMRPNCPVSCDTCASSAPTDGESCMDKLDDCASRAINGECSDNATYMMENCPLSCGQCSASFMSTCMDYNENCTSWANDGQCELNPDYMNYQCRKSCNLCSATSALELVPDVQCEDSSGYCAIYREQGMCTNETHYMNLFCPRSCGACPDQPGGAASFIRPSLVIGLVMLLVSALVC